jgi:hypothetical protein
MVVTVSEQNARAMRVLRKKVTNMEYWWSFPAVTYIFRGPTLQAIRVAQTTNQHIQTLAVIIKLAAAANHSVDETGGL